MASPTPARSIDPADVLIDPYRSGRDRAPRAGARRLSAAKSAAPVPPHDEVGKDRVLAGASGHDLNYIALRERCIRMARRTRHGPHPLMSRAYARTRSVHISGR